MKRDEVIAKLSNQMGLIQKKYSVKTLNIFGSVARDQAGEKSDVDLLVEFKQRATFDQYMDLKFHLEELLQTKVDLVTKKAIKPRMRAAIEQESVRVA
ncbi:MAG: nucleotidyltransferase family protein [Pseudomonadota bacterium]